MWSLSPPTPTPQGRIDFDDLQGDWSYSGGRAYSQSNSPTSCSPISWRNWSRSSHRQRAASRRGADIIWSRGPARIQRLLVPLLRPVMKSPTRGAATSIHLASAPELAQVSGRYFANRRPRILHTQLRPGGRGTALGGERGSGQTHRGTPCEAGNSPTDLSVPRMTLLPPARQEEYPEHNRVLIVDDHAPFRSIARQVLTADGFLVVGQAADGAEAIRACGELRPDLVLLDVQLPDIDGFAVAAVLTTGPTRPRSCSCQADRAPTTDPGSRTAAPAGTSPRQSSAETRCAACYHSRIEAPPLDSD